MPTEVWVALISVVGAIALAGFGAFIARKFGIGTTQERLVTLLQSTVAAQTTRIQTLENSDKEKSARIEALETEVESLKELTINQAKEIDRFLRTRTSRSRTIKREGDT